MLWNSARQRGVLYKANAGKDTASALQMASSEEFLQHFGLRLAQLIAPATPLQAVQQAIRQTLFEATGVPNAAALQLPHGHKDQRQLELVFGHDCRSATCSFTVAWTTMLPSTFSHSR